MSATRVDFYHLTGDADPAQVVAALAEKVMAAGLPLTIVADAEEALMAVDRALWCARPASFLPHGLPDDADSDDPIRLCRTAPCAQEAAAGAVALVDGRWRDEALTYARALFLFGQATIDEARGLWRRLNKEPEVDCRYWTQGPRGWREGP